MAPYISIVLIMWMIVPGAKSDRDKLLETLRSTTWPWFGESYRNDCPDSSKNWPLCFNPRPNAIDSTLKRVGIPDDVRLSVELEVTFSAPVQNVGICGKVMSYPLVEPFQLDSSGRSETDLLRKGAEIYRKFPRISWTPVENDISELIIIDAGYIKVNGYAMNIQLSPNNSLLGEALWSYWPPTNPALHTNPILIVIMKQSHKGPMTLEKLVQSGCVSNGLSVSKTDSCRMFLSQHFSQVLIKGLQVFYTDGSSEYEQFRACTKSTFCNETCINKFKSYVKYMEPSLTFTTVNSDELDMYVNLNFLSPSLMKFTACCVERILSVAFSFRAIHADDLVVETYKVSKNEDIFMRLEMSGSADMALDTKTLYSVLMVDPNEPSFSASEDSNRVHGHMWMANLKYQEEMNTPGIAMLIKYTGPAPLEGTTHRYFILLYSHTTAVVTPPNDFFGYGFPGNDGWDLTKLPADFKLRAVTWFRSSSEDYTIAKILYQSGVRDSCRMVNPSYTKTCPKQFEDVSFAKRASVDFTKRYAVPGLKSSLHQHDHSPSGGAGVQLPSTLYWCPSTNPLVVVTLMSLFIYKAMAGA